MTIQHSELDLIKPNAIAKADGLAVIAAWFKRAGRGFAKRFWTYTDEMGRSDTSSYDGLL